MKKYVSILIFILSSILFLVNSTIAMGDPYDDETEDQSKYRHHYASDQSDSYLIWADPYVGFGMSSSDNQRSISIGWRNYGANKRQIPGHLSNYLSPAFELEFNKMKLKDNNGEMFKTSTVNANLYLSAHMGLDGYATFLRPNPFYLLDVYAMVGGGVGDVTNDFSVGAGVGLGDIIQVGVKHTTFFGRNTKNDTSIMFKVNVPLAVPTIIVGGAVTLPILAIIFSQASWGPRPMG